MYAAGIPILSAHVDCQQTEWLSKKPAPLSQSHHVGVTKEGLSGRGK